MISPKDQKVIQIDVTNACVHRCSNCTRFCGHHNKTFFMDFETFKNAVDSLEGYKGCVGMIGGEPTLHPDFERFAEYLKSKRLQTEVTTGRQPIEDMQSYIPGHFTDFDSARTGLWSTLNKTYYKHFETINDCFAAQNVNDHDNTCLHQALLMSRKELGISDEEWIPKRDACWIQNTWSATITPKGAFFCEVAGALDMLFDGPGGWKVEPGWWKKEPKDFAEQLHWCELCSGCLDVPKRISCEEKDDMTPLIAEKLIAMNSPKMKKGDYVIHTLEEYQEHKKEYKTFTDGFEYMSTNNATWTTTKNRDIYPRTFEIIKGKELTKTLKKNMPKDWVIVCNNKNKGKKVKRIFSDLIINPGCLYIYDGLKIFNINAHSLRKILQEKRKINPSYLDLIYPADKVIYVPVKKEYRKSVDNFLRKIFSLKNEGNHKIITVMGIKIKIKYTKKQIGNLNEYKCK